MVTRLLYNLEILASRSGKVRVYVTEHSKTRVTTAVYCYMLFNDSSANFTQNLTSIDVITGRWFKTCWKMYIIQSIREQRLMVEDVVRLLKIDHHGTDEFILYLLIYIEFQYSFIHTFSLCFFSNHVLNAYSFFPRLLPDNFNFLSIHCINFSGDNVVWQLG